MSLGNIAFLALYHCLFLAVEKLFAAMSFAGTSQRCQMFRVLEE
jgi:hypothetical protein